MSNTKAIIETALTDLRNKNFSFNFFVMDTKGQAIASVANIYEHAKTLQDLGYNVNILHEKNDYTPVNSWLGEEYANIPHTSAESQKLQVGLKDFLIIPELFTNVMEQTKAAPCKKIVFCQVYDYVFDYLAPGSSWKSYNINTVVTTSEMQKKFLLTVFPWCDIRVVPVGIPEYFTPPTVPKKPIIAISGRQSRDVLKIIKMFYLKYPQFKWINFKAMGGMSRVEFAKQLQECAVAVWVDDISAFGTFPIEAMKTNTLVVGKVPTLVPEWMDNNNGYWVNNMLDIPDLLASILKTWLEDDPVNDEIYAGMKEVSKKYLPEEERASIKETYEKLLEERIEEVEILLSRVPDKKEKTQLN